MSLLVLLSVVILVLLSIPVLFFCLEVLVGLRSLAKSPSRQSDKNTKAISSVVLIPAHNESAVLAQTLTGLKSETVTTLDRILVIADNCSDNTASIARDNGVDVIERFNDQQRGKGFALEYALTYLRDQQTEPDVIVIFDADCRFTQGSLAQLKQTCYEFDRPIQSAYRLLAPEGAGITARIAEFAIRVKNLVRNRGLSAMGFPAVLTGTGMAFPSKAFHHVNLASGELAEDMKLGVDMTLAGFPAIYTDNAEVLSELPQASDATATQRERWEHGHLTVMKSYLPRLFIKMIKQKNVSLVGTFLDLTIPPLSLLVIVTLVASLPIAMIGLISTSLYLVFYSVVLLALLVLFVLAAWWQQGRDLLSTQELLRLPLFILSKLGVYRKFVSGPQTAWVRTKRDGEDKSS
ncbi:glycosyltransferase family 2 protein [Nitrincola schmidtii]|uniref:glycosyltransferase family 2 protein n=1 Tax=Nitrincola schmidtii TaxID=1730894 RepID=UPI00124CA163|nr:glycosyltransferase family 2 protein [Nitrincola schmidtii]